MIRSVTQSKTAGMTLVEAVVLVGIYTVLMLAVMAAILEVYRTNGYAMTQASEVDSARIGLTEWNRNTKEMALSEDGGYPLRVFESDRIGYFSDIDQTPDVEYVEYVLVGTTLERHRFKAVGDPPVYDFSTPDSIDSISTHVQNTSQGVTTFEYYDNNGVALSGAAAVLDVRYIKMQLVVNVDPARNPGEFLLQSSVAPRNIKDNL